MEEHSNGGQSEQNPYESPHAEPGSYFPEAQDSSSDERMWAMLCHLSTLAGAIIPFANIIGPLVIWLTKREEFPLVDDQGKEALNFQISMTIYYLVAIASLLILVGFVLLPALFIIDIVFTIIACLRANNGEYYRYPLSIRFVT